MYKYGTGFAFRIAFSQGDVADDVADVCLSRGEVMGPLNEPCRACCRDILSLKAPLKAPLEAPLDAWTLIIEVDRAADVPRTRSAESEP